MKTIVMTAQKQIMICMMVIMMFFGAFAFAPEARAQTQASSAEISAMMEQVQQLLQILTALQARMAELRANSSSSDGTLNQSLKFTQETETAFAGEWIDFATINIPAEPFGTERYLNKARFGLATETTVKPWERYKTVVFTFYGGKTVTIDASDEDVWQRDYTYKNLTGYVVDLYDRDDKGYGALIPNWAGEIDIELITFDDWSNFDPEYWTVYLPSESIEMWSSHSGNVEHGGIGVRLALKQSSRDNSYDEALSNLLEDVQNQLVAEDVDEYELERELESLENDLEEVEQRFDDIDDSYRGTGTYGAISSLILQTDMLIIVGWDTLEDGGYETLEDIIATAEAYIDEMNDLLDDTEDGRV